MQVMRIWHTSTFGSQAFFNSPRGRWQLKLLGAFAYLITFLQVVAAAAVSEASLQPDWEEVWDAVLRGEKERGSPHIAQKRDTCMCTCMPHALMQNVSCDALPFWWGKGSDSFENPK